jgi:hypothetical protein
MGLRTFIRHYKVGRKENYPRCCVAQFALIEALDIGCEGQGRWRGQVRVNENSQYVPCSKCWKNNTDISVEAPNIHPNAWRVVRPCLSK